MKVNENVVVSDVDGVLLDFDGSFKDVASSVLKREVIKVSNSYSLNIRYNLSSSDYKKVWAEMDEHEQGWSNLKILPGAVEAISKLQKHGFSVRLVTGISSNLAEARLANLERYGIKVDAIDCVGEGHASKLQPLQKHAPLMFFDDRLRLLHESDFVPHRVWIDHGDEQDGFEYHPSIHHSKNLLSWVKLWEKENGIKVKKENSENVFPILTAKKFAF